MKARLLNLWDTVRTGFWFIPTVLVLAAFALAVVMPIVDGDAGERLVERVPWIATTTAAARSSLAAIGGAIITVTGVVFSITIVALSIASSQFGSRTLRNFTDDRATQVAIGIFVGTSLYCFLIMRSVREVNGTQFVPHLSVAVGVLLAMVSLFVLILFIHHVALAIQAPMILQSLSLDLDNAIDRLFPEKLGRPPEADDAEAECAQAAEALKQHHDPVEARVEGYIQAIDAVGMIEVAQANDLVVELSKRPGDFISRSERVACVSPAGKLTDEIAAAINEAIIVGHRRTPRQDVGCTVDEMVEVAVRALSPGINDLFTAINCIDRLGASLGRLAERKIPSPYRRDDQGDLRLVARPVAFEDVLEAAFGEIRRSGRFSVSVMLRLLGALDVVAQRADRSDYRRAILRQADMILDAFSLGTHQACDRETLQRRYDQLQRAVFEHRGSAASAAQPRGNSDDQIETDNRTTNA